MNNMNVRLFILSVWMLFLELFIIRWLSTEIRIFAYVSNLVLLGCFIGVGVGCYFSDRKISVVFSFAMLSAVILAVQSFPFREITDMLSGFNDSVIWSQATGYNTFLPVFRGIILTICMFAMVLAVFFPLGQLLGRMFAAHNKIIIAYSINIAGSIAGVWLFSLLSFMYAPPIVWLIVSMACGALFLEKNRAQICLFLIFLVFSSVLITMDFNRALRTVWTPYQKLDIYNIHIGDCDLGYTVNVNNANYMELLNIAPAFVRSRPDIFGTQVPGSPALGEYDLPYLFKDKVEDILIVGSGGGNDVAGAVRKNIKNIDAVEIDPGVHRLGLLFHPERPYQDRKVHVFIDDARSFFKKAKKKYDVISFGLLDSHTVSSSYNNMRLDHYMYTRESFREAKGLLKEDGIITVAFAATRDWIAIRLLGLMKEAFKEEPLVFTVSPYGNRVLNRGWTMFVMSNDMQALKDRIKSQPLLNSYIEAHKREYYTTGVRPTTDDWPYLYLRDAQIPQTFLCIILSLAALFFFSGKAIFLEDKKLDFHFFFLGAAFMLLEFQNITKASLLFGSTWMVNAYTISAILVLILCANVFVHYCAVRRITPVYILLCLSVMILYFVPLNNLNIQNYFMKYTLIGIFLNLPVFFAGMIFINSLKNHPLKNIALGSNLLGASLGGLCESLSFMWGVKTLLLLVLIFYVLAYLKRGTVKATIGTIPPS